jgi:hypothetical protein
MLLFHIFNTETIDRSIVFKTIDCRWTIYWQLKQLSRNFNWTSLIEQTTVIVMRDPLALSSLSRNPVSYGIFHGISTPQPIIFWPMVYKTPSYGIMNSSLLVEMRGGFKIQWQKNWPRGQNTIWKIEPRVKISYENWPWGQFTMGLCFNFILSVSVSS